MKENVVYVTIKTFAVDVERGLIIILTETIWKKNPGVQGSSQ